MTIWLFFFFGGGVIFYFPECTVGPLGFFSYLQTGWKRESQDGSCLVWGN